MQPRLLQQHRTRSLPAFFANQLPRCPTAPAGGSPPTSETKSSPPVSFRVHRYGAAKDANVGAFVPSAVPDGCSPIHLNLVARHGTRSPTKKRIEELDGLASLLNALVDDAKQKAQGNYSLQKIPSWLSGWQSPWKGIQIDGELISEGEKELYDLGIRTRERFPKLFDEEYHPDIFKIRATEIPRASASAVAFGNGLFSGRGSLRPAHNRTFAVINESRANDTCLRFHEICTTYKEYKKSQKTYIDTLKEPVLKEIASALVTRYHLNFSTDNVSSLWFLCKQEASLLEIRDQACGLFNASEVSLLEWTDDVEVFILKGYGKSINYRMGVRLLKDVVESMEQAVKAKKENHKPGTFEKARLRFAHAETLVPFTCLLGLFLDGSEYELLQAAQPLSLPPKPPQKRNWISSKVSPFAGNTMLVLFQCHANDSNDVMLSGGHRSNYLVQVLHNEIPVPMPGCGDTDLCPFEDFKEKVVGPYLKHDFDSVCNVKLDQPEVDIEPPKPCSTICKLFRFLCGLFLPKNSGSYDQAQKTEL